MNNVPRIILTSWVSVFSKAEGLRPPMARPLPRLPSWIKHLHGSFSPEVNLSDDDSPTPISSGNIHHR